MSWNEILKLPINVLISSLALIPTLVLFALLSMQLLRKRKKRSYRTLSIGFILGLIGLSGQACYGLLEDLSTLYLKIAQSIWIGSYIVVLLGMYQLYHVTSRYVVYGVSVLAVTMAVISWNFPLWILSLSQAILGIGVFIFIGKGVGKDSKFKFALVFYVFSPLSLIVSEFFTTPSWINNLISITCPLFSYFLLFFILFERVIDVMQTSYISSITDYLTGLYNRKYYIERLTSYVQRNQTVIVLFSDIDNFKKLNDTKGHNEGDRVLKQVARILMEEVEGCGIAGRIGGEEMVLLVTDSKKNISSLAESIRFRIEKETIVTVSIGYSTWKQGVDPDMLIKQADQAMYQAKPSGKNRVVAHVFSGEDKAV